MKRLFNHEPYKYDDDTLKQVHRGILGTMTDGIVAAYYGRPKKLANKSLDYLPGDMIEALNKFCDVLDRR